MSFDIKWNPNFEGDLKREVKAHIEKALRQAVPLARCPDHRFTLGPPIGRRGRAIAPPVDPEPRHSGSDAPKRPPAVPLPEPTRSAAGCGPEPRPSDRRGERPRARPGP